MIHRFFRQHGALLVKRVDKSLVLALIGQLAGLLHESGLYKDAADLRLAWADICINLDLSWTSDDRHATDVGIY